MSSQKEEMGPRLSSVIIIGILTFVLGKFLGLASLVSQPVQVVTREPENIVPGTVYYQKGNRSGRLSSCHLLCRHNAEEGRHCQCPLP